MAQDRRVRVFRLGRVDDLREGAQVRRRAHAALQLLAQPEEFERHRDVAAERGEGGAPLFAQLFVADQERALDLPADQEREKLDRVLVLRRGAPRGGHGD